MSTTQIRSIDAAEKRHYSPSATIIESSRLLPWLILLALTSGTAISISAFAFYEMIRVQRKYDLLEIHVRDQNAILIREGLKLPTDVEHGPAGNYQYEPRRK